MNARRVSPISKPGALLKAPRKTKGGKRPKRELAPDHLSLIRKCPCVACDNDRAGVAAHLRLGVRGGIALKPDDRWTTPLCTSCHGEQHSAGEIIFWLKLGVDPVRLAEELYRASPSLEVMRSIVFRHREKRR